MNTKIFYFSGVFLPNRITKTDHRMSFLDEIDVTMFCTSVLSNKSFCLQTARNLLTAGFHLSVGIINLNMNLKI